MDAKLRQLRQKKNQTVIFKNVALHKNNKRKMGR